MRFQEGRADRPARGGRRAGSCWRRVLESSAHTNQQTNNSNMAATATAARSLFRRLLRAREAAFQGDKPLLDGKQSACAKGIPEPAALLQSKQHACMCASREHSGLHGVALCARNERRFSGNGCIAADAVPKGFCAAAAACTQRFAADISSSTAAQLRCLLTMLWPHAGLPNAGARLRIREEFIKHRSERDPAKIEEVGMARRGGGGQGVRVERLPSDG